MGISLHRTDSLSKLSAKYLKDNYLLGMTFVDAQKKPYGDDFYEQKLQVAMSSFETYTQVSVEPELIKNELHDYHSKDYQAYALIKLFRYPVLVSDTVPGPVVTAMYPSGQVITTFPKEWVRLEASRGTINLLPTSGTISTVLLSLSGAYLPAVYAQGMFLPKIWGVTYTAGFPPDKVPVIFLDAICKLAAIEILTVMANSIYPAGLQSQSLSADGLSTSRSIVNGPDTAPVFSGTIKQYKNELFGMPSQGITGLFDQIQQYYHGISMTVLG